MIKKIFLILFFVFFPFLTEAQIIFNEIMYDPEGSDTNKEYVEIKNTGNSAVNLENYKFFEANTNHKIYDGFGNDFNLPGNSYGLIVKNPDEFKIAYPDFSGFILKSSFSLKNTDGEEIALKDKDGNTLDSLIYNPNSGGKDGDTLSLFNNIWKNGSATPNAENVEKAVSTNDDDDDDTPETNHSYSEITDMFAGQKKLHAEIDEIKTVIAGAQFEITGRAYGLSGVEIKGIDFLWNLGDGTKDRDQRITHEYYFPGEYLITLIVKSSGFTSPAVTKKVLVIDPPLEISQVDFKNKFIEIKNNSNQILNIQDWILMVDGDKFIIPPNTYILENGVIKFSQKNTLLQIKSKNRIFLLYPDKKKFQEFKPHDNSVILTETKTTTQTPVVKNTEKKSSASQAKKTSLTTNQTTLPVVSQKSKTSPTKKSFKKSEKTTPENSPKITEKTITLSEVTTINNVPNNNIHKLAQQTASILPLKLNSNSFVQNNLIEISFTGLLLLIIFSLLFFKHHRPENLALKQEADDFEILEED